MMIAALMMRLNSGGKPDRRMPVLIAWMMTAPSTDAANAEAAAEQ